MKNIKDKEQYKAQSWCFKNDIYAYPVPTTKEIAYYKIIVSYKGQKLAGTIEYKVKPSKNEVKWYEVIFRIYISYYNKLNKK